MQASKKINFGWCPLFSITFFYKLASKCAELNLFYEVVTKPVATLVTINMLVNANYGFSISTKFVDMEKHRCMKLFDHLMIKEFHAFKALFLWSQVPETILPPSNPGQANFSLKC